MATKRTIEKLIAQMRDGADSEKLLSQISVAFLLELMTESGVRFRGTTANTLEEVAGLLTRVRDSLELNNTELGERTGLSRQTISATLRGSAVTCRLDTLGKLVNALSVPLEFEELDDPPRMTGFSELTGGSPLFDDILSSTPSHEDLSQQIREIFADSYNPSLRTAADRWAAIAAETTEELRRTHEKLDAATRRQAADRVTIGQQQAELDDLVQRAQAREGELNARYEKLRKKREAEKSEFDRALERLRRTLDQDRHRHNTELVEREAASRREFWAGVLGTSAGLGSMMMFGDKMSRGWQATVGAAGLTVAGAAHYGAKDSMASTGATYLGLGSLLGTLILLAKKQFE